MTDSAFEQQFEKDNKLEHITFLDVLFLYEENETYYPAKLELFGRSSETISYVDGEPYAKTRSSVFDDRELTYRIIEIKDELLTLKLHNDDYYKISIPDFERYKAYIKNFNIPYIEEEEVFVKAIQNQLSKLLDDTELVQMAKNFVDGIPLNIFLDPINIIGFECFLEIEARVGRSLLLSDELQRSLISQVTEEVVEISPGKIAVKTRTNIENFEVIKSYLDEGFVLFASLVKNRFALDEDDQALYLTYIFLNRIVVQYFSDMWANKYKDNFENASDMEYTELLKQYSQIEAINPNDLLTMGTFVCFLMKHNKFETENYLSCFHVFQETIEVVLKQKKLGNFASKLKRSNSKKRYTINDIDLMNGLEFEHFLEFLFSQMGYETQVTKASGDQGIDIIVSKDSNKIGIQAKCYSGSVGNSAVQEAVAGIKYYHLDKAIVVTNSSFTDSAIKLANANGIVLWDRNILKEKISELL